MRVLLAVLFTLIATTAQAQLAVIFEKHYEGIAPLEGISVRSLCPEGQRVVVLTVELGGTTYNEGNCINGIIGMNVRAPDLDPYQLMPMTIRVSSTIAYDPKLRIERGDCVSGITTGCVYQGEGFTSRIQWSGDRDWIRIGPYFHPPWSINTLTFKRSCRIIPQLVFGEDQQWYIVVSGGPPGCVYGLQVLNLY